MLASCFQFKDVIAFFFICQLYRFFSSKKVDLLTYIGRNLGVNHALRDLGFAFDNQECATPISKCDTNGGSIDCNIRIRLAFSGTDKMLEVLNTWYEVRNLRRYSLVGLYQDINEMSIDP